MITWDAGAQEVQAIAAYMFLAVLSPMFFLIGWRLIVDYIKDAIK